jgi:nucleoside-diphosphate-sugar epimerase
MSGDIQLALSHVLPDLVQKTLKGQNPIRVLGSGNQVRHLTYGGDLAKGISMTLENPVALNEDFNISTDESLTVLELAEKIWKKVNGENSKFLYVNEDPYPHDVQKRIPDTSKAKNFLNFRANTTIDQVLDEVIPWVKEAIEKNMI